MAKTPKVKFKLGDRPETFPEITVDFKTNRGLETDIKAVFKYRTREEFGAFIGQHFNVLAGDFPRKEDGQIDYEALAKQSTGNDAAYLKDVIQSWDLEDEVSLKTLQQMASEQPAAIVALKAAYGAACNEGRLGN